MNKLGNDFNPSRYVPDGFSLLPETANAGMNAYEQQEECSASERRQAARIQQVRDGRVLSVHKYGNSGAGLLFVFRDFFSKKERISLLLKLSKSYKDHSRIQSKNWEGKSISFHDYSTWKVSVMESQSDSTLSIHKDEFNHRIWYRLMQLISELRSCSIYTFSLMTDVGKIPQMRLSLNDCVWQNNFSLFSK